MMADKEPQNRLGNNPNNVGGLARFLAKYLRYWYLFLLGLVISLGMAFFYLHVATPKYLIRGTLLVKTNAEENELPENAAFRDLNTFQSSKKFDNEIEVLKSYNLMQKVLKRLPVNISYYVEGAFVTKELYGSDLPLKVIVKRLKTAEDEISFTLLVKDSKHFDLEENGKIFEYSFGEIINRKYGSFVVLKSTGRFPAFHEFYRRKIIVVFENLSALTEDYSESLEVEPINTKASVLNISMKDALPERGRDIINKVMEVYRQEALDEKNLIAASTINLIDNRLKHLAADINNIEKNVEEYKRQKKVTEVSSQSKVYVEESSRLQQQLAQWSIQIDILETIENYLTNHKGNSQKLVPSTLTIQDPTLQSLISKFNDLQLERERMLRSAERMNPLVQSMDQELQVLRTNILENIRNIKAGLIITRKNLETGSELNDQKIDQVPSVERDLVKIDRQREIKQELYKYLLEKREQSTLSLVSNAANSQVLKPAIVGTKPVEPKRQTILLLAIMAGFGLPLAGISLINQFARQIKQRSDVEIITATPIIGEISFNDTKEELVVSRTSSSSIAELFRLIRTNLQFVLPEEDRKVILVTSSVSGEGKTFFSLNLGASISLTGKKVVVVDFDLRKAGLGAKTGRQDEQGVTDYLNSDLLSAEEILHPLGQEEHLFLASAGTASQCPAELMVTDRVAQLFKELKGLFDYIIVDTAPVGQFSDAFNLAKFADLAISVVRYNYTHKADVAFIDDIFVNHKFRQSLIVLNGARKFNSYKYGYGYGNGKRSKMAIS